MAAMIPTPFDWSRLVAEITDESFGIPPDVTFQIVDNGQLHEVKAHKMILGMVSPTFKTMFYATNVGDKTANVIKIEKTTAPAFQIMIDAVYNVKSIEVSLEGKSVHEVLDVVILVDRYQIAELMEAVKEHLANYPITDDTVLEVAAEAKEYTRMFEAEAQQLLVTCAKFLDSKLKDRNAVTRYAAKHEDRGEVLATLLARMNDVAPSTPTLCANCNEGICLDWAGVKKDEFREGLLVTNNRAVIRWGNYDLGTGRVTMVEATNLELLRMESMVRSSLVRRLKVLSAMPCLLEVDLYIPIKTYEHMALIENVCAHPSIRKVSVTILLKPDRFTLELKSENLEELSLAGFGGLSLQVTKIDLPKLQRFMFLPQSQQEVGKLLAGADANMTKMGVTGRPIRRLDFTEPIERLRLMHQQCPRLQSYNNVYIGDICRDDFQEWTRKNADRMNEDYLVNNCSS